MLVSFLDSHFDLSIQHVQHSCMPVHHFFRLWSGFSQVFEGFLDYHIDVVHLILSIYVVHLELSIYVVHLELSNYYYLGYITIKRIYL